MKIYYTPSGEPSRYPTNRDAAKRLRTPKFYTGEHCEEHKEASVQFTANGKLACCANHEAAEMFNTALKNGDPVDQKDAIRRGLDYFWTPNCCAKAGHVGKRMAESGECWECVHTPRKLSARQEALRNNEKWYQPTGPCRNGHVAPRRVYDGKCKQCEGETKVAVDVPMSESAPDLIISKESAKGLGLNMFRTGKPCKRGHTGYRYVSTGGCVDCKKESD